MVRFDTAQRSPVRSPRKKYPSIRKFPMDGWHPEPSVTGTTILMNTDGGTISLDEMENFFVHQYYPRIKQFTFKTEFLDLSIEEVITGKKKEPNNDFRLKLGDYSTEVSKTPNRTNS